MTIPADLELEKLNIDSYLARLASSAATPGGGAVIGLAGAQAAALLSMVCNLSQAPQLAECSDRIDEIGQFCEISRQELLHLANEDARVFKGVMGAYGLPKSNESETSDRQKAIQLALAAAAEVPRQVMEKTSLLLPVADELADIGNPRLISDVGVAVYLIDTALQGAKLNIVINTRLLRNGALVQDFNDSIDSFQENLVHYKTMIMVKVQNRLDR